MLDDLRNSSSFIDEEETNEQEEEVLQHRRVHRRSNETFMGMTAQQRFILSLMMFLMVCMLGSAALVLTGSIAIPGM